jgi:hypothetical protein
MWPRQATAGSSLGFGLGGANDRNYRQILAEEDGRLRHDQVGLEIPPPKGEAFRLGKVTSTPVTGSLMLLTGGAFPDLSCQVWNCAISVPPMLSRIRNTSTSITRCRAER